jgi:NTE family protein
MAINGLVLSGGGARAAYQVGVLRALREMGAGGAGSPFGIYSGTSAGAINAAFLACGNDRWEESVDALRHWWEGLRVELICHADAGALLKSAGRWAGALGQGWLRKQGASAPPESLLDNAPLRELLAALPIERAQKLLERGQLHALAVSAFNYATAKHTVFYSSSLQTAPWTRKARDAREMPISREHLMASCALPLLFPTVLVGGERFGDGALRQTNPVSPAIHLGADRVLVIETTPEPNGSAEGARLRDPGAVPSPGQILGHALANILADQLASDVERVEMVNRLIDSAALDERQQQVLGLRRVELVSIRPSEKIEQLASEQWQELPKPLRRALAMLGADARRPAIGSYLLFEPGYVNRLIAMGREDAFAREAELREFFGLPALAPAIPLHEPHDPPLADRSAVAAAVSVGEGPAPAPAAPGSDGAEEGGAGLSGSHSLGVRAGLSGGQPSGPGTASSADIAALSDSIFSEPQAEMAADEPAFWPPELLAQIREARDAEALAPDAPERSALPAPAFPGALPLDPQPRRFARAFRGSLRRQAEDPLALLGADASASFAEPRGFSAAADASVASGACVHESEGQGSAQQAEAPVRRRWLRRG